MAGAIEYYFSVWPLGFDTAIPHMLPSGRRAIDGAAISVTSGPIIEDGAGMYHLNAYSFDMDGNNIGMMFSASGAATVCFTVTTTQGISGTLHVASGTTFIASGPTVSVPIASISGAIANSGLFVTVPIASISGAIANSGLFVVTSVASGTLFLASGSVILPSGGLTGILSGQTVNIYSGQLSGRLVDANITHVLMTPVVLSGAIDANVVQAAGNDVQQISGYFVTQPASGVATVLIPDGVLLRDYGGLSGNVASGTSGRCLLNATRKLINKWSLTSSSGYLDVFQEDDALIAYQQSITTASGAPPLNSTDTR